MLATTTQQSNQFYEYDHHVTTAMAMQPLRNVTPDLTPTLIMAQTPAADQT
jgi:hypothetical protein